MPLATASETRSMKLLPPGIGKRPVLAVLVVLVVAQRIVLYRSLRLDLGRCHLAPFDGTHMGTTHMGNHYRASL
jgi:hypothetical protein